MRISGILVRGTIAVVVLAGSFVGTLKAVDAHNRTNANNRVAIAFSIFGKPYVLEATIEAPSTKGGQPDDGLAAIHTALARAAQK